LLQVLNDTFDCPCLLLLRLTVVDDFHIPWLRSFRIIPESRDQSGLDEKIQYHLRSLLGDALAVKAAGPSSEIDGNTRASAAFIA
jgi:hypothetical protein